MPATAHPGAGCDKCAQHRGSGGDGWSSSFSLLEKRVWCQGLWVSHPAKGPPGSLTVSWWERQSEGRLLGSPGPWLAAFSPGWMCRALNYLQVLEAWHRWLPGSSTAPPCWRWDSSERRSASWPTVSALHPPSWLPDLSLSHVISFGPDGSCLQFSMFPHL